MNIKLPFCLSVCFLSIIPFSVKAQIIEDGTLSTEVNTENNLDFTVNAGEKRGDNLFHSFQEFSIPNNGSASFDNAVTIQNIITRVTGSSISEINGLIQTNGTANLFLLNPNGIIFGENASLDIGGSFIGTTAESLLFEDGTEFSTNLDNSEPLLTVNVPLGLQFGSNPGKIINRANFKVSNPLDPNGQDQIKLGLTTAPGKTFALLGGDVTFDGGAVTSPTGNIELGSVAENSFVTLEPIAKGWQANYENVSQFQDIQLDSLASVDASGEGAGNINVQGRNIQILNGSAITSSTLSDLDGGIIKIQASDLVEINGSDTTGTKIDSFVAQSEIFLPFASQISSNAVDSGKGGDINIITKYLRLIDGAAIELRTFPGSKGQGGNLFITASESTELSGIRPLLGVGDNADNKIPSTIPLDTIIDVNQASEISTVSFGSGNAGNINIVVNDISLKNAATIATSPINSDGGNINVQANESIEIIGVSPRTGLGSSSISASTFGNGNAGNLDISTSKLTIKDGGLLISTTATAGNAGNINVDASSIEISGFRSKDQIPSLISTQTDDGGDGGNIFLNTDKLVISDRASLSVKGTGDSVPGNLTVNANSIELTNFGSITAATEFQSGGNIKLDIEDNLILKENSLISAQAINEANGGNVDIDANFIIAFPQQNNDILASAVFGDGGNITVNAEGIFGAVERSSRPPNLTNDIDASSEFGTSGTVELTFPLLTATNVLFKLPSNFVDVNYLFNNTFCKISQNSSFIATGRGGIPFQPEDEFLSEQTWSDWRMVKEAGEVRETRETRETEETREAKQIAMIQGWVRDAQGNVVLTDKPLVVAPRKPGLNTPGCNQVKSSAG